MKNRVFFAALFVALMVSFSSYAKKAPVVESVKCETFYKVDTNLLQSVAGCFHTVTIDEPMFLWDFSREYTGRGSNFFQVIAMNQNLLYRLTASGEYNPQMTLYPEDSPIYLPDNLVLYGADVDTTCNTHVVYYGSLRTLEQSRTTECDTTWAMGKVVPPVKGDGGTTGFWPVWIKKLARALVIFTALVAGTLLTLAILSGLALAFLSLLDWLRSFFSRSGSGGHGDGGIPIEVHLTTHFSIEMPEVSAPVPTYEASQHGIVNVFNNTAPVVNNVGDGSVRNVLDQRDRGEEAQTAG